MVQTAIQSNKTLNVYLHVRVKGNIVNGTYVHILRSKVEAFNPCNYLVTFDTIYFSVLKGRHNLNPIAILVIIMGPELQTPGTRTKLINFWDALCSVLVDVVLICFEHIKIMPGSFPDLIT